MYVTNSLLVNSSGMLVSKLIQVGGRNMLVSWLTQIGRLVCWLVS